MPPKCVSLRLRLLRHALLQALLGGVGNVLEVLRAEGVPAPTVRGVAWACLRWVPGARGACLGVGVR